MTTSVRVTIPQEADYKVFVKSFYKTDINGRPEVQVFLAGDDVILHIWDDKALLVMEVPLDEDIEKYKNNSPQG